MSHDQSDVCREFQPRLAAIALGETPAEADVQAHLAQCPQCQADLRAYAQVGRILPYAAPTIAPPPELRDRILALATGVAAPPARPARKWRRWGIAWPAFAAACVAIIALLGWNLNLQQQLNERNQILAASRDRWVIVTRILNAPDVQSYAMSGNGPTAHVWFTPQSTQACLVAQGLPDPGTDKVYQIWLQQGNQRISGGTFEPVASDAWTIVSSDRPIASYSDMNITIEPRGGSPAPTGPTILRATLDSAATPSPADRAAALKIVQAP